jgi:glycosyltransferase involved in cell wall biosynthesis
MALEKVALVIPGFQSSIEDWCIPVFTNLAREMAGRVELRVFALRYPPRRDCYPIGEVHVHSIGGGLTRGRSIPVLSLALVWRRFLSEIAREHAVSPFSAVAGIWATESGFLATLAAQRLGVPSLVHVAGGELVYFPQIKYGNWRRGLAGRLVAGTLQRADILTVPSGPLRRTLLRRAPMARVRDWAPGVDTRRFHVGAEHSTPQPFTFVTAGSLIPVKGHTLLVRALAELRATRPERTVRLQVLGGGPLRPHLESLAAELDLTGYVAFEGEVRHDRLPAIYGAADAFLLGSWHESQCMAALEAMACGLPCVAPPVGALADLASLGADRQSVFLFTERSPAAVAAAMRSIVDMTPAQRRALGMNARERVARNYDMVAQTEMLLALLEELTSA